MENYPLAIFQKKQKKLMTALLKRLSKTTNGDKMKNFQTLDFLKTFFSSLGDEIFLCDLDGNIKYKNPIAEDLYPKTKNINKLSHLFNFEICILKSEDILSYNPISAALEAKEPFGCAATKQINNNMFVDYFLNSWIINSDYKLIVLKNDYNKELLNNYEKIQEKNSELEEQILNTTGLKTRLENQLLRTNLINLVSEKVREYIDTKKIIKIVLEQLKKTIDIKQAQFNPNSSTNKRQISNEIDEKTLISKLFIPVYQGEKIYGEIILYRKNQQNTWQKEEIDLVKNIASLLSTAFSKEELYERIEMQKNELEKTLIQLKNAQLQIVQSEKMAALGQLVAGVAHEINTPLGAISSNLHLLETMAKNNNPNLASILEETMSVNNEAIKRIEKLVKSLKNFTRLDEAKKKFVNLQEGILSTLDLLAHETKNKVTIKTNFENLPMVSCYPDYINQVFMNILLNACQSIKANGEVEIHTYQESNNVVISIKDNGSGIKKENLEKIFDFGFTTKKIGQGTGLGLALAKKIIEEHKGKITVESKEGKGTTFNIYLPIK